MYDRTTISVSRETYFQLKELGHVGDSFNSVIESLLAEQFESKIIVDDVAGSGSGLSPKDQISATHVNHVRAKEALDTNRL
jgi:predicted CopG family antitoxin